jgi:hypothetical protein
VHMLKAPSRPPTPGSVSGYEESRGGGELAVFGLLRVVTVDEAGGCQAAFLGRHEDAVHGSEEARVIWRNEEHEGSDQD